MCIRDRISVGGQTGYVMAKFVTVDEEEDYIYDADCEKYLTSQGFPESYKDYLRKLHAAHPNWVFKAQKTGLDWNDVIEKESVVGINLIHKSYPDSWKSKEYGAYDPDTGEYGIFDIVCYVAASEAISKYLSLIHILNWVQGVWPELILQAPNWVLRLQAYAALKASCA